ncbi:MAG TPA: LysM domain-containing protein [Acidimicrobiales bacterium]|nr:LysM domain-containing protein [Acidimicrobiales bacterium]
MKAAAGVGVATALAVALLTACGGGGSDGAAAATTAVITTTSTTIATTTTATEVTYVIAKGDSLSKIAKKFNMTVAQLITINNIKDADKIEAGQVLIIVPAPPGAEPTTTAPAAPPST